jgi:hypothetical protein
MSQEEQIKALQAQVQQLVAAVQHQQQVNADQQARLQQLQAAQAPAASAPAAPAASAPSSILTTGSRRPRITAPSTYVGTAAALDGWLQEMQQQFAWYGVTSEADRISMGAGYLRSVALDWWASLEAAEKPGTWDAFTTALRERFQPLSAAALARRQLDVLRQGQNQSVHEYIAAFRRLAVSLPSMHEEDRVHAFVRGLRPAIAQQVLLQRATTVKKAIEVATFAGSISSAAAAPGAAAAQCAPAPAMEVDALTFAGIEGLENETANAPGVAAAAPAASEVTQLRQELNALRAALRDRRPGPGPNLATGSERRRRPLPMISHLSPQQVKEYLDAGKCFGCGSNQHQYRACPQRGSAPGK